MRPVKSKKNLIFWIVGFFAFLWVVVRSGTNPKRLTYPCQQALYPVASSWLIALLALVGGSYILKRYAKFTASGIVVVFIAYFIFVFAGVRWICCNKTHISKTTRLIVNPNNPIAIII